MKNASKLAVATALVAAAGAAQAGTVTWTITGGNWDSISQWTAQADGTPATTVFDAGDTPGCNPIPVFCWTGAAPPTMTGTYSGTLVVETGTNNVVGGSLIVSGSIADMVFVGSPWWVRQFNDLTINFDTMTASAGSTACYATFAAPVPCGPAVINAGTTASLFAPRAGIASQDPAGVGGIAYAAATFDASTGLLQIFRDGRRADATGGTDVLNRFTLQVVPVPAAAWLFGSALGLLGVARRKLAA
jgi:hypothetical protein